MKRIYPFMALLLLGLLLPGCHQGQTPLREAIRQYCLLLAEGYQALDMNKLGFVATPEERERVYRHMAALGEARTRMVATLLRLDFVAAREVTPIVAQVRTRERWTYAYVNMDSGTTLTSNTVEYTLEYHLHKRHEQWLVASVEILASGEGKGQESAPFLQRPAAQASGPSPGEK